MKTNFIKSWGAHAKKGTKYNIEIRFGKFTLLKLYYDYKLIVRKADFYEYSGIGTDQPISVKSIEFILFNFGFKKMYENKFV